MPTFRIASCWGNSNGRFFLTSHCRAISRLLPVIDALWNNGPIDPLPIICFGCLGEVVWFDPVFRRSAGDSHRS